MSHHIYIENQKILCYHGDFLYEAKVLKVDRDYTKKAGIELHAPITYFVHYNGWNKTWDEWVPSSRLMPLTQDNLSKQKQLFNDYERKNQLGEKVKLKKKKVYGSNLTSSDIDTNKIDIQSLTYSIDGKPKTCHDQSVCSSGYSYSSNAELNESNSASNYPSHIKHMKRTYKHSRNVTEDICSVSSSKKPRKLRYITVSEDVYANRCSITISIPTELKLWLIDDHDLINRQQYLISIPKRVTVVDILNLYSDNRNDKYSHGEGEEATALFCSGIKEYFDISLGMELLYKFERSQYVQLLVDYPHKAMSEIYGIEHLLRLFVKLSGLLSFTKLDGSSVDILESYISEILCFLEVNLNSFHGDYTPVSQEYVRRMTCS